MLDYYVVIIKSYEYLFTIFPRRDIIIIIAPLI